MSDKGIKQSTVKASRLYGDYLIMTVAPLLLALYHYGARALAVVATCVASAMITDLLFVLCSKRIFCSKT